MRFEITIKEFSEEKQTRGNEWENGAGDKGSYGYTPEIMKTVAVERVIYKQNVENINLTDVVKAVNMID